MKYIPVTEMAVSFSLLIITIQKCVKHKKLIYLIMYHFWANAPLSHWNNRRKELIPKA